MNNNRFSYSSMYLSRAVMNNPKKKLTLWIGINKKGYHIQHIEKKFIYADIALLFAENEDNLQCLLYQFNKNCKKFNIIVSLQKSKFR